MNPIQICLYQLTNLLSYVGPFLFVNRILPLLKKSAATGADVRIISVGSSAHRDMLPTNFKFQFDTPEALARPVASYPWQWRYIGRFVFGFDMIRYSVAKAAVVLFVQDLQRRLDEQGIPILSIVVHPGEVATEGVMTSNTAPIRVVARLSFITPEQGAVSPLFVATATEVRQEPNKYKGKYVEPIGVVKAPNPVAEDQAQVKGLWENTTRELDKYLAAEHLPALQAW